MRKLIILSIILSVFLVACRSTTKTKGTTAATTKTSTRETTTKASTKASTKAPTQAPTEALTEKPTEAPTEKPTEAPTEKPTEVPTEAPTVAPTQVPTVAPTKETQATTTVYDDSNPFNHQDNNEVPYDPSRWIQPGYWNTPKINPKDYKGGIMLFFDKIGLQPEYSKGKVQRVYFSVIGAAEPVSHIKFHIFYDERLSVVKNAKGEFVNPGRLMEGFSTGSQMVEDGQLVFYGVANNEITLDRGCIFTIDFIVPENAQSGDLYPFGLAYVVDDVSADIFGTSNPSEAVKLQMTYVFTKGIYNGYIKMQ